MNPAMPGHRLVFSLVVLVSTLAACSTSEKSDIEVEVRSVGLDATSNSPVVVLQDHDRRIALPIWIGPLEAQSIAMQMEGVNPPRPMTHDLIKVILDSTGIEFEKVLIQDLKDSTYYARIFLRSAGRGFQLDSRPSDAIALAVRFNRPIFVARELMTGNGSIDLQRRIPAASTAKFSGITVQNLTEELAAYFDIPSGEGVIVADVAVDAPPGLQRGDVILEMNGTSVTGVGDLAKRMEAVHHGASARLSVQRGPSRVRVQFAPADNGSLADDG